MTDRVPLLLLAGGWLLALWGLAELFGWWIYPVGAGIATCAAGVALAGWRNLLALLAEGGLWKRKDRDEGGPGLC